ncbi:SGNH/GDSL hydrolase family protein [Arcticibacterium luteifluviistationis]|uniref:SGNH/GDSL hydrolase family protein n=1 Tax=Arcticibacterium luteifluviistationis TaxID=1784714 RepID=A0A2Z4GAR6_9BACT|nr:SGNH/GDSL hydrolase family protein [Arcticibacterium luteifluviistationis]AWV98369.1 SGNH/GDSL hydrolase family protein [Arcticibacterium luteifluviistationis]
MKTNFLLALLCLSFFSFSPKTIKWVAIGDSITYLNDHLDETGNRVSEGYMTRVSNKLPHINYINQGHNGWTASRIAEKIDDLGIEKADAYSVFLSTNDWWAGKPVGSMADYENNTGFKTLYGSYRIIIDKLKELNPAAPIVLVSPFKRVDFVYIADSKNNAFGSYKEKNGQNLEQFANAILDIAKHENLKIIDLYGHKAFNYENLVNFKRLKNTETGLYQNYSYPDYTNINFNADSDEYPYPLDAVNLTYDGLHPSDKGNELIAKEFIKIMKKY